MSRYSISLVIAESLLPAAYIERYNHFMEKSTSELKKTAEWLRAVAEAMDWNLVELAAAVGVSRVTMYRWFIGKQEISTLAKRRLLDFFLAHEVELRKKNINLP